METAFLYFCEPDKPTGTAKHWSVYDVYLLEYCAEGYGTVWINENTFALGPGDCYMILPGDRVRFGADPDEPRRGYTCVLDGLLIEKMAGALGVTSQNPYIQKEQTDIIVPVLEQLLQMQSENDMGAESRRLSILYGMIGKLLSDRPNENWDVWVKQVIGLIDTQYHRSVTVQSLAESLGMDRSYFTRRFKEKTGVTPYAYLTDVRVEKACFLLKQQDISVGAVALAVGLEPRNFSRIFKAVMGMTPQQYRNQHR